MSKVPSNYLQHILDECNFIISTIDVHLTKDEFVQDETLKRAIVRSLQVIGEATKQIPVDYKMKWPEITWGNMAGMRDRLIHD
jgi:uncharacterized protein with HEPN domain